MGKSYPKQLTYKIPQLLFILEDIYGSKLSQIIAYMARKTGKWQFLSMSWPKNL